MTEKASWRWIWWINLPCSGVAILVLLLFLRLPHSKSPIVGGIKSVDWLGSLSVLGLTIMLLLGLQFGGVSFPWKSPTVICLIIFGFCMIAVFLFCEAKVARYPVMPLALFRQRSNVAALLVCFFHGFVSCMSNMRRFYRRRIDLAGRPTFRRSISFPSMFKPLAEPPFSCLVYCSCQSLLRNRPRAF